MPLILNGETLPPGFRSRLNACSLELESLGFPSIGVASGSRPKWLQEQIFRDRYIPVADAGGRNPFNDKRWWLGMWWVRVKAGGTVLPPGSSTHEDPPASGVDLAWPYNNRYTAAHAMLLHVCEKYGIRWTGRGFGEDWHFDDMWDPYASFAGGNARPFEEDELSQQAEDAIFAIKAALLDGRPQSGMAKGALDLILENTTGAYARIRGPVDVPWDMLQDIQGKVAALGGVAGAPVDVDALAAAIREGLGADVAAELVKRLAS